jgi:hypothetical protein
MADVLEIAPLARFRESTPAPTDLGCAGVKGAVAQAGSLRNATSR